jgi:hypothetical protein
MPMKYMAGPPVDAMVHRRAAGSFEFSETETARRNDPILVAEPKPDARAAELAHQAIQGPAVLAIRPYSRTFAADAALGYRRNDPVPCEHQVRHT